MRKLLAVAVVLSSLVGCSASNLDYVRENGSQRWREVGFDPVAYQGFRWGYLGFGTPYGGAEVWWELRKIPDNGITYSGYLKRWGNEPLQVYGPIARDAIAPRSR